MPFRKLGVKFALLLGAAALLITAAFWNAHSCYVQGAQSPSPNTCPVRHWLKTQQLSSSDKTHESSGIRPWRAFT